MPQWASPWLWTGDTWAGLQFAVLVVAAIVAYRQVRETRRLRDDQTRPFVVVDVEPDDFIFMIAVANLGPTMARDVRITIDPPLTSSIKGEELDRVKMFREAIPSLAPGRRIRTILDSSISRERQEYPDIYTVRVRYTDDTGQRHFDDNQVIDLGLYWDTSEIRRKTIHNAVEQLEKLVTEAKKWTADLGGGLLTVSDDDYEKRAETARREQQQRRKSSQNPQT